MSLSTDVDWLTQVITLTVHWASWRLKSSPFRLFLSRLFRRTSKKTSKLCVTGLCQGIHWPPVDSPHKGPDTAISWRHHVFCHVSLWFVLFMHFLLCHYTSIRLFPHQVGIKESWKWLHHHITKKSKLHLIWSGGPYSKYIKKGGVIINSLCLAQGTRNVNTSEYTLGELWPDKSSRQAIWSTAYYRMIIPRTRIPLWFNFIHYSYQSRRENMLIFVYLNKCIGEHWNTRTWISTYEELFRLKIVIFMLKVCRFITKKVVKKTMWN